MANLALPNEHESQAVDARQEIDLRIGASFTRLQTLLLQNKFDWGEYAGDGGRLLLRCGGAGGFRACGASSLARAAAAHHGRGAWLPGIDIPCKSPPHSCSYGPCQFPTLGLIVQRWWEIQAHIPEQFWHIQVGWPRSQPASLPSPLPALLARPALLATDRLWALPRRPPSA
jgi:DNA topoisomerase-3